MLDVDYKISLALKVRRKISYASNTRRRLRKTKVVRVKEPPPPPPPLELTGAIKNRTTAIISGAFEYFGRLAGLWSGNISTISVADKTIGYRDMITELRNHRVLLLAVRMEFDHKYTHFNEQHTPVFDETICIC